MKAARARRDAVEAEIIDVLKIRGYCVRPIAQKGLPDLLVWWRADHHPWLVEVKSPKGKLRATQHWAELGLRVTVLRSAEDAMRWVLD